LSISVGNNGRWSSNWVTGSGCQPVLQSNTPGDPNTIHPRMLCSVCTMCIALLHDDMYACACPTSIPSVRSKTYGWRATVLTLFVFVLIATRTMTCQDLTPGLAPSQHPCMQPHFTPTSSPFTLLHLIAICILAIKLPFRHVPLGLASVFAKDSATLYIPHTPWQSIQKSLGCTPLFPSPKNVRLWGVHRHPTGWRLVGVTC